MSLKSAILVVAGALASTQAQAGVGTRVLVQEWQPAQPERHSVRVLDDQPTIVSDALLDAWGRAREPICEALTKAMGQSGVAAGQTLRDIECELAENVEITVGGASNNTLQATLAIPKLHLVATSTTPTVLGKYADPRFSVDVRAEFALTLNVQDRLDKTLTVSGALFRLQNAQIDSHNLSGDVLEFVAEQLSPFFGGPNYKKLAEDAINSVRLSTAGLFNSALGPVNNVLTGPSGLARVSIWGRPNRITVAFAPREVMPPTNGSMSGFVRWNAAEFAPREGCASFQLSASVQTAPPRLMDPDDYDRLAPGTHRPVGAFSATPAGDGQCAFTLSGLAAGWPHSLQRQLRGGGSAQTAGSRLYSVSFHLSPDGWDGVNVLPQPTVANHNYVVSRGLNASDTRAVGESLQNPLDPVMNDDRFLDRAREAVGAVGNSNAVEAATPDASAPATQGQRQIDAVRRRAAPGR